MLPALKHAIFFHFLASSPNLPPPSEKSQEKSLKATITERFPEVRDFFPSAKDPLGQCLLTRMSTVPTPKFRDNWKTTGREKSGSRLRKKRKKNIVKDTQKSKKKRVPTANNMFR
ncbi:hypothetical protein NPIL_563171 [Nephila pilipes]|uniref:Uncharacterized protein n=1 Tax=Nephila pilipes TaxID=299642 RepID=A0A8X6P536_NEPPI|nr:hypothetical protein NPIL_563171 [Nephila pilipes]